MTSTRKNISQPADWWAAFEARAKSKGRTLSEHIGEVCREDLPKRVRKTLSKRPPANRPAERDES